MRARGDSASQPASQPPTHSPRVVVVVVVALPSSSSLRRRVRVAVVVFVARRLSPPRRRVESRRRRLVAASPPSRRRRVDRLGVVVFVVPSPRRRVRCAVAASGVAASVVAVTSPRTFSCTSCWANTVARSASTTWRVAAASRTRSTRRISPRRTAIRRAPHAACPVSEHLWVTIRWDEVGWGPLCGAIYVSIGRTSRIDHMRSHSGARRGGLTLKEGSIV